MADSQLQCLYSSPGYRWPSWGRSPGSTTEQPLSRPANEKVLMIIPKIKNISTNKVFFKEQKNNFPSWTMYHPCKSLKGCYSKKIKKLAVKTTQFKNALANYLPYIVPMVIAYSWWDLTKYTKTSWHLELQIF